MLGDIEVARGRLDRAAAQYEEVARMYSTKGDLTRAGIFLKAGQVHFEQRQPEAALAVGRRLASPWAAGLRGTAYLLLKNQAAAEKEFAGLRASLAPLLGEYMAGKAEELHRLLAASYAGRSRELISGWRQLPGQLWPLYVLEGGLILEYTRSAACRAFHKSTSCCRPSQNSGVASKNLASRWAISAFTDAFEVQSR
jgi:hypothetical protein